MRVRLRAIACVAMAAAGLGACGRSSDSAPDARADPDPAATIPAAPTGDARPAPAKPVASATTAHATTAHAAPSSSTSPPTHPLATWMRGPATQAFNSGDLESIASTFDQMIPWAPKGFPNWASIARDGGQAARAGSLEGAKAACRSCHAQYDTPYRATLSTRPLP